MKNLFYFTLIFFSFLLLELWPVLLAITVNLVESVKLVSVKFLLPAKDTEAVVTKHKILLDENILLLCLTFSSSWS